MDQTRAKKYPIRVKICYIWAYMEIAGRLSAQEQTLLKPSEAQYLYRQIELANGAAPREDVLKLISHYPVWKETTWSVQKCGSLEIYFDGTPWNNLLTNNGRMLTISETALNYEQKVSQLHETDPNINMYIERIANNWRQGLAAKPALIIPGSKYPQAPVSDFLDGTKSTLASFIFYLRTGKPVSLDVYVGQKAPLLKRALKILSF